jgi:hypothetical protein
MNPTAVTQSPNGQARAEEDFRTFDARVAGKTDADFREVVTQGRLNRGEICRECNFGRSALIQNPRIKRTLHQLEERLRATGIFPVVTDPGRPLPLPARGQLQAITDGERLKNLHAENADQRAELSELRQRLKRFERYRSIACRDGRLTR